MLHSIYQAAYVKGIAVKTVCEANISDYPTYSDMASDRNARKNSLDFIGVPYNVGATSHRNAREAASLRHSFGCPRFFFRFNITSAIFEMHLWIGAVSPRQSLL